MGDAKTKNGKSNLVFSGGCFPGAALVQKHPSGALLVVSKKLRAAKQFKCFALRPDKILPGCLQWRISRRRTAFENRRPGSETTGEERYRQQNSYRDSHSQYLQDSLPGEPIRSGL